MPITQVPSPMLETPQSFRNAVINGCCRVGQRGSIALANNVSTYGGADRIMGYPNSFTSASGTLAQTSGNGTTTGYAQQATLTTTGTGSMIFATRLEAKDVARFGGRTVTISAKVYQDTGSAVTTAIQLYKANATDNFSSSTQINTTVTTGSVPTATWTTISATFTPTVADATTGMMIFWQFQSLGAVTAKNFAIGDMQMELGSAPSAMEVRPYQVEEALCMRYFEVGSTGQSINNGSGSTTVSHTHSYRVRKRAVPATLTVGLGSTQYNGVDAFTTYQGAIAAGAWYNPAGFTASAEL